MAGNKTFSMIKPNAVKSGHIGHILAHISDAGFRIVALKMTKLSVSQASAFYGIHEGKPFFNSLIEFMYSGPVVTMILEKENAVEEYRKLIGATNPQMAEEGTIRKLYGVDTQTNAVHGSDSDENAFIEANFFFSMRERFGVRGVEMLTDAITQL
ncbi:MAG: nucleoside-diphosphate kinase [Bacteroidales bacterium]|nr:nucleoside-diphosphate kinase [Bacteroidales bacterium]